MQPIHQLPIVPETYETSTYQHLPGFVFAKSEMTDVERRFVHGLLRYYKPANILEVGVSRGGGTAVVLNAIRDMPGSRLVSVDLAEHWYMDPAVPVGAVVLELYPEGNAQWELHTGKDPLDVLPALGRQFDFCIIDTVHVHPAESLNFLTVLPYLTPGAVVVLHDIGNYINYMEPFPTMQLACKLLFDNVAAHKLRPAEPYNLLPNIGAFQVTEITRDMIANVFYSLEFPWGFFMHNLPQLGAMIESQYGPELSGIFQRALEAQTILKQEKIFDMCLDAQPATAQLQELLDAPVFIAYGAGENARRILAHLRGAGKRLPDVFWDRNAASLRELDGIPVVEPALDTLDGTSKSAVLVTITNYPVSSEVMRQMQSAGFTRFMGQRPLRNALGIPDGF